MSAVGRSAFLAPAAPALVEVPLPECGEGATVFLRALSAKDLLALRKAHGAQGDTGQLGFAHELLSRTLCDGAGTLLFTDAQDLADGFGLSLLSMQSLAEEAIRHSGLEGKEGNSQPRTATS